MQGLVMDVTSDIRAAKALEEREGERRRLVGSLLRAAEAERCRFAAELHDDTVQILAGALLDRRPDPARLAAAPATTARMHKLRMLLAEAMERAWTLMFEINPQLLHLRAGPCNPGPRHRARRERRLRGDGGRP